MRQVILLRGINVGAGNRLPMADLRAALADSGLPDAKTYVQSGNIVLETDLEPSELRELVENLIHERFGMSIPVVTRAAEQLQKIISENPFVEQAAADPKHVQVTFLAEERDPKEMARINALAAGEEAFLATPTELYSWHPDGIARSKLALALTDKRVGTRGTARNWATVTKLLEMARDAD